ncbi:EamA-like transporter family protein [Kineococcus xinjiangensis]|uniref:EamA-like transporter family protein n=1 Tax=Kineococcus xinjiangensis TaxID=512762 RepID=A0A2S6IE78_9ACTN|nr:DMT family transporter [Kineococcus xinjiangensis]PPK92493.1 EamA-like transporter family protein [Kineococcus xinjiangensis]
MTRRAFLLFTALGIAWGIPYLLIKIAGEELSPSVLVLARTALASLVLLPFALTRPAVRAALPALARHWRALLAFTVIEISVPWLFLARAEQDLSSSTTAVLISVVPVAGVAVAFLSGRSERLGGRGWLGLVLGTAGVATLVGFDLTGSQLTAAAEVAVVVVGYAIGPAILARKLGDLPGLAVVTASLVLSTLIYVPVVLLGPGLPASLPSGAVVASVVVLAVVCTAAAFVLLFALIGELGPVRATAIVYVNPVVAVVAGALVLSERISVWTLVGFAGVLIGSVLVTRRAPAAASPAREPEALVARA